MEDLDDFLEFMDMVEIAHMRMPKVYIRDHSNPFEFFYEEAFKKRFKFSKEAIMYYILPIIEDNLIKDSNRGLPVTPVLQLLIALRFYATGNYQAVTGDLRGFSQSTVCRCIKAVSIAFAEKLHEYVHFPKTVEGQRSNIRKFYEIAQFPNVAACIDGTLIKIANPNKEFGEIFRSRKGTFSLNILAAAGPRGEILFIDVRHPGSTHDSTCFDRSALKLFFMENRIKGLLLGDNGYGCQSYLLTPVLRPLNQAERNYNKSHRKTRNVVERTFGRWKRKFSCLKRGLLNKLDTSIAIICATAVLWNLHIHINCPNENSLLYEESENAIYLDADPPRNTNGLNYRLRFIIRHFVR